MTHYEYKVIPAPAKGEKGKGARTPEARFAHAVEGVLNRYGESGWEYVRAELLPSEERSGLTGTTTQWRTVLIFRKALGVAEVASVTPVIEPVDAVLDPGPPLREIDPPEEMPPLEIPDPGKVSGADDTVVKLPDPDGREGR